MSDWFKKADARVKEVSAKTGIPYDGCWNLLEPDNEYDQVRAIRAYLLTPDQKKMLQDLDMSLEQALHGDYRVLEEPRIVQMFEDWNTRLGQKLFG